MAMANSEKTQKEFISNIAPLARLSEQKQKIGGK